MRLEKIIEALKNCEPDKALIYAEDAIKFAKEQCGNSVPSSGHGYLEEIAGLYRVRTMQWEDAELRARPLTADNKYLSKCPHCRMYFKSLRYAETPEGFICLD